MEQEKSLQEVQEELAALGFPKEEANKIRIRSALYTIIDLYKKREQEEKVDISVQTLDPKEEETVTQRHTSKKEVMKQKLMKQLRDKPIRMMVPLDVNEKPGVVVWEGDEQKYVSGAYQPVTLNGFTWLVPKGVYTEVPEQVAEVLSQRLQQGEAERKFNIDRIDPRTGRSVRERLQ